MRTAIIKIIKTVGIAAALLLSADVGQIQLQAQQPQNYTASVRPNGGSSPRSAFRPLFGNNVHVYLEGKGQSYPVRNLVYDPGSREFLRTEERSSTAPMENYRGQRNPNSRPNPWDVKEQPGGHLEVYRTAAYNIEEDEIPRYVHVSAAHTEKSPIRLPHVPPNNTENDRVVTKSR